MDEIQVVKEELTTPQPSEGTTPTVVKEETTQSVPGEKTDSALLLKSLQEEREKRRIAEERSRQLEEEKLNASTPSENEVFSDEGKIIVQKYVEPLKETIISLEDKIALKDLQIQYPVLKDLLSEFNEYRKEYPRHKLDNVAKLFLTEKGLIEPTRKGLERQTGGTRTPSMSGQTAEDVKKLRETNYKKYQEMVRNGQIQIE
jgi:hypothetical protein